MIFIVGGIIIVVLWAYVLFIRPQLAQLFPDFFAHVNRIEWWLWDNSRTIISARLYWVGGILVGIHDLFAESGADMTPVVTEVANFLPDKYRPLLLAVAMVFTGLLFEWLRRKTTEPLEDKEP